MLENSLVDTMEFFCDKCEDFCIKATYDTNIKGIQIVECPQCHNFYTFHYERATDKHEWSNLSSRKLISPHNYNLYGDTTSRKIASISTVIEAKKVDAPHMSKFNPLEWTVTATHTSSNGEEERLYRFITPEDIGIDMERE